LEDFRSHAEHGNEDFAFLRRARQKSWAFTSRGQETRTAGESPAAAETHSLCQNILESVNRSYPRARFEEGRANAQWDRIEQIGAQLPGR